MIKLIVFLLMFGFIIRQVTDNRPFTGAVVFFRISLILPLKYCTNSQGVVR